MTTTRFCEYCLRVLPLTEFRRRRAGGTVRMRECRACHNQSERDRRARKQAGQSRKQVGKYLTRLNDDLTNKQIRLLCSAMISHFGGLQGFIGAWSDYYQYARKQRGLGAYRCLESVIRLMQYCEENRRDTSEMTDEELTCSIREDLRGLIQQCPELAVTAASEIGWRVEPVS